VEKMFAEYKWNIQQYVAVNDLFILSRQHEKAGGNCPAGSTLGGKHVLQHLTLLALIVVIVTIKVKIIIKKQ
jgi:hypothetical protein